MIRLGFSLALTYIQEHCLDGITVNNAFMSEFSAYSLSGAKYALLDSNYENRSIDSEVLHF